MQKDGHLGLVKRTSYPIHKLQDENNNGSPVNIKLGDKVRNHSQIDKNQFI